MAKILGIPADVNEPLLYALSPARLKKVVDEARASVVEMTSDPIQTVIADCTFDMTDLTSAQELSAMTSQGVDPSQVPVDPAPVEVDAE